MRLPKSETKVNSMCTCAAAVMKLALLGLSKVFRQQGNPCDFENGLMDRLLYLQTGTKWTQATTDVGSSTSQHTWRNSVRHHVQRLSCLRHKHRPAVCWPWQPWYQCHHFRVWEIDVSICERVKASGMREKDVVVFARVWGLMCDLKSFGTGLIESPVTLDLRVLRNELNAWVPASEWVGGGSSMWWSIYEL